MFNIFNVDPFYFITLSIIKRNTSSFIKPEKWLIDGDRWLSKRKICYYCVRVRGKLPFRLLKTVIVCCETENTLIRQFRLFDGAGK